MKQRVMAFREVYQMFMDIWGLYRKYAGSHFSEDDCEELMEDTERLRKKYNSVFASEVLVAVLCELSRIAKIKEKSGRNKN